MSEEKPKAAFVTFYSFKGGVGRSMALINTAGILAGRGFRVLVIDLDLEAPGLSYLDPDAPDISPEERTPKQRSLQLGFVDLLSDAKERGEAADLFALSASDLASRYTQPYHLPDELREFKDGSLHIMPAGRFDGHYAQRFDALNLRELYQEGLGEPLIRTFKKKFAEADLYDYVLVDSRTGFSDEAGICTRDLADYLMVLSGLNHQNIQGTCEFLKALRVATDGKKRFQIILSPVPNGEDDLVDQREAMAKASFEEAWGAEVDLSLQIPYHPQLALTEEPHIFRRRRGHLFEAYRAIERRMLAALGHKTSTLRERIEKILTQKNYPVVLRDLRHMVRLDGGKESISLLIIGWSLSNWQFPLSEAESDANQTQTTLSDVLGDLEGQHVIEFMLDHLPEGREWSTEIVLQRLQDSFPDFADRLYRRTIDAVPNDANLLGDYAVFLEQQRSDLVGAEGYYRRALDANPKHANNLGNYGQLLMGLARLSEGEDVLLSALEHLDRASIGIRVKICFSLWLIAWMQGHAAEHWERCFKFFIQKGFKREPWSFERVLDQAKKVLSAGELEYAEALARAFLNESQVTNLERYERWRALEPLDPKVAG